MMEVNELELQRADKAASRNGVGWAQLPLGLRKTRKRGGWEISDQKTTVFDGGAVRGDSSGKSLFFFGHIFVSLLTLNSTNT